MSFRDAARHRSPQRARTPLTDAADALGDRLVLVRRSGTALAVSGGLVASLGLPAQAAGTPVNAQPATPAVAAAGGYAFSNLQLAAVSSTARISAPAMAKVSFDTSTLSLASAPAPVAAKPAAPVRTTAKASRSSERSSLKASASSDSSDSDSGSSSAVGGSSVLDIAARYVGTPYVYGGTTPSGFDCSGYVGYVYGKLGIDLPRTANAQMNATKRVSRSQARPGDIVFFVSGGHAYHDGIYAGGGQLYDAPRAGKSVSKRDIWDATIVFGRVTG